MKSINKGICALLLMTAIGAASSGNFITAAVLAIWPAFVCIVSFADSVRRYGL